LATERKSPFGGLKRALKRGKEERDSNHDMQWTGADEFARISAFAGFQQPRLYLADD
jgi:hypothetical protein